MTPLRIKMISVPVTGKKRKLKAKWTFELDKQLEGWYGGLKRENGLKIYKKKATAAMKLLL